MIIANNGDDDEEVDLLIAVDNIETGALMNFQGDCRLASLAAILVVSSTCFSLGGCADETRSVPRAAEANKVTLPQDDTKVAIQSWEQFVDAVRSNCSRVERRDLTIAIIADDITKSDSLKSPYEGQILLKDTFGSSRQYTYQWDLRFHFVNGEWTYARGEGKILRGDRGDTEKIGKTFPVTKIGENPSLNLVIPPASYSRTPHEDPASPASKRQ